MLAARGLESSYCQQCRDLHRARNDQPSCEKGDRTFPSRIKSLEEGIEDEFPVSEYTGKYCEMLADKVFQLHANNYLPFEILNETYGLSARESAKIKKGEDMYNIMLPTLSQLEFVVSTIKPEGWDFDEFQLVKKKIILIHGWKIANLMSG